MTNTSIIITGPSELRTERSDFVRERCDCVRIGLPDSVGRRSAYYDFIAAVYDRPLHGTPWISEPRVQTRNARNEERSSGVQSGKFSHGRYRAFRKEHIIPPAPSRPE